MTATFFDKKHQFEKITEEIYKMDKSYVLVGFQDGTKTKQEFKSGRTKKGGEYMAQIAAENEFGTRYVPARPFMSTSYDENRPRINKAIEGEYDKIVNGKSTVKRSLGLIGLFMQDLIQEKIRNIHFPPNSPTTIAMKKSSKPLIDFGQMIQSVRYKVFIK